MKLKFLSGGVLIIALIVTLFSAYTADVAGYTDPIIEELIFSGNDFDTSNNIGSKTTAAGLTLADNAATAVYTSPILEAPIPFNAVVPQWIADLPEEAELEVAIRTQSAQGHWTEWKHLHAHSDWTLPGEAITIGEMVTIPAIDGRHTHIQFQLSYGRLNPEETPLIQEFSLVFIDSTSGPTVEEMLEQQAALDAAKSQRPGDGYPRPTVISRDVWCISDACDYDDELEYSPATHMVIHHTVSANDSADWATTVRAIWSYHTHSREWGDIGYNYLIDQDGIIYEGHLNEDYETLDVAGTHASGANLGSMGVALLGTFTEPEHAIPGIEPPEEMIASLVELLSWKADQQEINVFDASNTLPNLNWGLPHIMGHRNVYGTTACPGDQAHDLIPELIERVAAQLGQTNPYIIVDEQSEQFSKSDSYWYTGPDECGTGNHAYYTYSTTDPDASTNWGEWRPDIPEDGIYRVEVRAPYCYTGRGETNGATYQISHAYGTDTVVLSHSDLLGQWMTLGEFQLTAGISNTVRLSDLTLTDDDLGVWFDDMRLLRVEPNLGIVVPTETTWSNSSDVTFAWDLMSPTDIMTTTLSVRGSPSITDTLLSKSWVGNPISYTHTFSEDVGLMYWWVTAVLTPTNQTITSTVSLMGVDTAVPTSTLTTIYDYSPDRYQLNWEGSDDLSGIAGYDLSYRVISDTTWTSWLTNTLATSADFIPPNPTQAYEFHLRAIDNAGNTQSEPLTFPNTTQAIPPPHVILLPMVTRGD